MNDRVLRLKIKMEKWQKISETPMKDNFRKLARRVFLLPDGRKEIYDVLLEYDTVCVLALTTDQKVILAKQFRTGPEKILNELPGGYIEKNESPKEAIKKELLEETGYSGKIDFVGKTIANAYSTRISHHFAAIDCHKIAEPKNDKNEFTEVVLVSLDEFKKHLKTGKLTDSLTAYTGLNYLKLV
ncbi:MAG: ADP-ribose pyrophosphatase [Candidatus Berkelbacteria bacterium]|nr:ADP-ribose pyrophosphatase [Candidatus Berkelbacteria bacterium]